MSLIRQFWIAIAVITLLSLGGNLAVSTLTARHYLEQQLSVKNIDHAASLAQSLSRMDKNGMTVEDEIATRFDAGHFRLIRLTDRSGKLVTERRRLGSEADVPAWFVRLVPLAPRPGVAPVHNGPRQFGTLMVEDQGRYAYESLWHTTVLSLLWFIGGGLLCGITGTALLKRITRPLQAMVAQAESIAERRFVTTPEPRTPELRALARSMNALSERIRSMLGAESQRLEELRRQAQCDELTRLDNRPHFLNQLDAALARDDVRAGGALVLVRVEGLAWLNQRLGRAATDALLRTLAQRLRQVAAGHVEAVCGRLNASDFALLTTGGTACTGVADALDLALTGLPGAEAAHARLLIAAVDYVAGEARSELLARVDGALAAAEESGAPQVCVAPCSEALGAEFSLEVWRSELQAALAGNRLRLEQFAVVSRDGTLLHHEAPVRMQLHGRWQNAGRFMPWAARLGMVSAIDACAVRAAVRSLEGDSNMTLAIKLSAESLCDRGFRESLHDILKARPTLARRLWIDVREASAVRHQVEFRALCLALRPLGCRMGLDHAGHDFSRLAGQPDFDIDHLKISAAFVRGIEASPANQSFIQGLCSLARPIGLMTIAQGVASRMERDTLAALGVDGMTGPAIRLAEHD